MASVLVYWRLFLNGLIVTLQLSVITIITSSILGFLVGILYTLKCKPLRAVLTVYVQLFRSCPILMLLYMGYFGMAYLGFNIDTFPATVLVFTLYGGAYIAEIIRSGIESVPKGQWEAAHCVGLSLVQIMKDVILPQSLKVSLPALVGFYLGMIKDTSVASIINCVELLKQGKSVAMNTSKPFETYFVIALLYFVICFPLSKFVAWLERREKA